MKTFFYVGRLDYIHFVGLGYQHCISEPNGGPRPQIPQHWAQLIPPLLLAPFELLYGRQPQRILDNLHTTWEEPDPGTKSKMKLCPIKVKEEAFTRACVRVYLMKSHPGSVLGPVLFSIFQYSMTRKKI